MILVDTEKKLILYFDTYLLIWIKRWNRFIFQFLAKYYKRCTQNFNFRSSVNQYMLELKVGNFADDNPISNIKGKCFLLHQIISESFNMASKVSSSFQKNPGKFRSYICLQKTAFNWLYIQQMSYYPIISTFNTQQIFSKMNKIELTDKVFWDCSLLYLSHYLLKAPRVLVREVYNLLLFFSLPILNTKQILFSTLNSGIFSKSKK